MNLSLDGKTIFHSEVTNVTRNGFWILMDESGIWKEYFVSFRDYPSFEHASVEQLCAMQQIGTNHLHWAEIDEDIEIDALREPEKYALLFKRGKIAGVSH
ncbi:MAG: DUF2442 domain-containing protein [Chloroflexota bacterium]